MTRSIDWTKAADLPPDELDRLLEEDHDEVDDNPPSTDEQLAQLVRGTRRPGQRGPGHRPAKVVVTMRLDPATLASWEASGEDWRVRMQELLTRKAPKAKARA